MLRGFAALHCYCVYKAEAYPVLQMTSEYASCSSTVAEVFSFAIKVSYSHDKPNVQTSPKITKHPYLSIVAHPDPLGGLAPKLEPKTHVIQTYPDSKPKGWNTCHRNVVHSPGPGQKVQRSAVPNKTKPWWLGDKSSWMTIQCIRSLYDFFFSFEMDAA